MARERKTIPKAVSDEVLFRSGLRCCICGDRGDQIHHIDSNPANNLLDNLVFLCFSHHNDASIAGGLSRRLTPELIKRFREDWHTKIKQERAPRTLLGHIAGVRSPDFDFQLMTDALIRYEVQKLRQRVAGDDWNSILGILPQIYPCIHLAGLRGKLALLEMLDDIAIGTRNQMPVHIADAIGSLAYDCLPINSLLLRREEPIDEAELQLFEYGINIANALIYDGAVKLGNLSVVNAGVELIWRIHRFAYLNEWSELLSAVVKEYEWLNHTLSRSDADPLLKARSLLNLFRGNATEAEYQYPILPDKLEAEIYNRNNPLQSD